MKNAIKQELFKLRRQKIIIKHTIALIGMITGLAILSSTGKFAFLSTKKLMETGFNSSWLIVFFMVYLASQTFSMEFRYGTIKNILQKNTGRSTIFFSKLITMIGYSVYLNILVLLLTVGLANILSPKLSILDLFVQHLAVNLSGDFIGMWLFASFSLLISLLIKNDALASMVGITFYFVSSLIAGIQFVILRQIPWLCWNPFNMLNLANQLLSYDMIHLTKLTIAQLIMGNLFYCLLFIFLAKMVFTRKQI